MEEECQLEADTNAEESWTLFKKVVLGAAEKRCGATKGGRHLEEAYKNMKREAKAAVAKVKNEAYKEWHDKMGTKEGERMIYKVAQQRARSRRDIVEVNVVKDQIGEMLTDEVKIKERWREFFSNLLNIENAREQLGEVLAVEGPVQEI